MTPPTVDPRISDLLIRWEELRAEGREVSVDELCRECPALVDEVRRELARLKSMDARINSPTVGPDSSPAGEASPSAGGRYQFVREHAKGGLGEVCVAHDTELNRSIALKRIQARHANDPNSRRRFLVEAEVTARLEHPGVVPVYGLVTDEDGQPSYAMRFIEGESLADAIKSFHGERAPDYNSLAFRQLLQRFITVCNTIAYAHSRGIIHRDIKPANVMLGKYGETLVVDWGLAKPVERRPEDRETYGESTISPGVAGDTSQGTPETQLGKAVGTPAYMSPEQAAGRWDIVGTASDIYSLGTTLYVLLTGRPAFNEPNIGLLLFKVQQGDYLSPRTVNHRIPVALEAICVKAMARQPEARYAFALDLAADLERWLADEAVTARRESWMAQAGRWGRKHRAVVTSAAVLLIAVVVGLGLGLYFVYAEKDRTLMALEGETKARQAEERERKHKQAIAEFVENDFLALTSVEGQYRFGGEDSEQLTKDTTLLELLDRAADKLRQRQDLDASTQADLYWMIGVNYRGVGKFADAVAFLKQCLALRREILGTDHEGTLSAANSLGVAYDAAGRIDLAVPILEETLKHMKAKLGTDHPSTLACMMNLASAYTDAGKLDLSPPLFEEALKLSKAKLGADHYYTLNCMSGLARAYKEVGKLDLSLPLFEEALKLSKAKLPSTLNGMRGLAGAYREAGKPDLSLPLFEEALKLSKAKLGNDHPYTINCMSSLAGAYREAGKRDLSLPLFEEALKLSKAKLGDDHPYTINCMSGLAMAYNSAGKLKLALPLYEETLKLHKAKLGADHPKTLNSMDNLAYAYRDSDKLSLALPLSEETVKLKRARLGAHHPYTLTSMNNLAYAYYAAGRLDLALPLYDETLKLLKEKLGSDHPRTLTTMSGLASAYLADGKLTLALPLFEEAASGVEKRQFRHEFAGRIIPNTILTYQAARQFDKAEAWQRKWMPHVRAQAGPESVPYASELASFGWTMLQQQKWTDAESTLRECLAIREKNLGDVFITQSMLGEALLGQRKYADAEPLLLAGYEGMKQRAATIPPKAKARLTEAVDRLVQLYEATGQKDEATKWRKERETLNPR